MKPSLSIPGAREGGHATAAEVRYLLSSAIRRDKTSPWLLTWCSGYFGKTSNRLFSERTALTSCPSPTCVSVNKEGKDVCQCFLSQPTASP